MVTRAPLTCATVLTCLIFCAQLVEMFLLGNQRASVRVANEWMRSTTKPLFRFSHGKSQKTQSFQVLPSAASSNFDNKVSIKEDSVVSLRPPRKQNTFPFAYHQEIEMVVEDLSNLGMGVGKYTLDDGRKWVVMVPSVLPGETIRCRIFKNYDSYSDADLIEVVTPSPDRVTPPCPHYSLCGGCQYQHMTIEAQRTWKRHHVATVLSKIGQFDPATFEVEPVVGSEHVYGYRSKITPHYDKPFNLDTTSIGFLRRGTRSIVDIDKCIIASPAINERFTTMRKEIMDSFRVRLPKKGASLLLREGDNGKVVTDHRQLMTQTVNNITFEFKAGEFFQNNPHVLPLMVDYVIGEALATSPANAGGSSCDTLVDTYCGSGMFSLSAAHAFRKVYGVEVSSLAVEAAEANAKRNGIHNVEYLCGQSEQIFATLSHVDPERTVMIIDPPRKGCDESFLQQLFAFRPKRLVYISCEPSTQARDAKVIVAGGYKMKRITPFDLFPQTRHIENVITFESS